VILGDEGEWCNWHWRAFCLPWGSILESRGKAQYRLDTDSSCVAVAIE